MISYRIDIPDPHTHLFEVSLRVPDPAAGQRLSLPVWIPGSYLVREFARHVSGLHARQGSRDVTLTQLDKATWLARCSGRAALVVRYRVHAFDTSVRAAFLDAGRAFITARAWRCASKAASRSASHRTRPAAARLAGRVGPAAVRRPRARCGRLR